MTTRKEEFMARAQERLAAHSVGSPEYAAELEKINGEINADVAAAVAEERARIQAEVDATTATGRRLACDAEALSIAREIAHDEGCAQALYPQIRPHVSVDENAADGQQFRFSDPTYGTNTTRDGLQNNVKLAPKNQRLAKGQSPAEKAAHRRRVREALGEKPDKLH